MPMTQLPISKGVFKTQFSQSLQNSEFAENLINLMIDQAGANFDRPTLDLLTTLDSTEIIGMTFFDNRIVAVTLDRKIYAITTAGVITDITSETLPGTARPTFANSGDTLYIAGGGTPIKWAGQGNTTAALGGSPPSMTHIVYLDDYLIGNRRLDSENNKVIQFSDNGAFETWTGTNIFSAVADPDEVQSLTVSQRELFVVGEKTTEVWQNIGASPIPFARAFIFQHGTPAKYSVIEEDNSVFMLNQKKQFLRIAGRQAIHISAAIDNEISNYETISDCWGGSFVWKGSIHILFVFPTQQKAWSFDLKNNQWSEWRGYDGGWDKLRMSAVLYLDAEGRTFAGDFLTGKMWEFSDSVKTDAEGIFKRMRTFSYTDKGSSVRKQDNLLRVKMKRNVASAYTGTTPQTNPTVELRWKDDGKPWSDYRQASLGVRGTNADYVEFRRLGTYRNRQYEVQISDPAEANIVSIESDTVVMAS